jgi:hypothetical protein
VKVSVPVAAPLATGENETPTAHLAPAAMLVPQVLLATAKPVLVAMLEKVSDTFSWFVSATVLAGLVLPTFTMPKFTALVERVTCGIPIPISLTVCVPALSLIVRVPDAGPATVGENAI